MAIAMPSRKRRSPDVDPGDEGDLTLLRRRVNLATDTMRDAQAELRRLGEEARLLVVAGERPREVAFPERLAERGRELDSRLRAAEVEHAEAVQALVEAERIVAWSVATRGLPTWKTDADVVRLHATLTELTASVVELQAQVLAAEAQAQVRYTSFVDAEAARAKAFDAVSALRSAEDALAQAKQDLVQAEAAAKALTREQLADLYRQRVADLDATLEAASIASEAVRILERFAAMEGGTLGHLDWPELRRGPGGVVPAGSRLATWRAHAQRLGWLEGGRR